MSRRTLLGACAFGVGAQGATAWPVEHRGGPMKPYVHPLRAPDGTVLSLDAPADHLHHHGLMMGWSDVNGFDFWAEAPPEKCGRMVERRAERSGGVVNAELEWTTASGVIAVERRILRPRLDGLIWDSEIRAPQGRVMLKAHKLGFDGLGVRFIRSMDGGTVLNSAGTRDFEKANGEAALWCAYTGKLPDGRLAGAAILNHPKNPRHPSAFFVMNQKFGYLSAAPTFREPLGIEPGASVRFRYAVITFTGEADAQKLTRVFGEWTS